MKFCKNPFNTTDLLQKQSFPVFALLHDLLCCRYCLFDQSAFSLPAVIMIDWPSYNESLVRRGQVLLDYDALDGWDHELSQMNHGKVGEPYAYPDSFIQLLGYMRAYFPSTI